MWTTSLLSPANMLRLLGALGVVAALWIALSEGGTDLATGVLVAALAVVGVSFALGAIADARARREAEAFAASAGWTYFPQLNGLLARLNTPPFTAPETTYTHVVTGTFAGLECYDGIFEWRVRIDEVMLNGKHRVAAVRLRDELPRLRLIPEGATARLAKALGATDKDFESAAFNRSWRVIAEHPKVAHDMLSPRVLEKLNALGTRAPMIVERGLAVRIDDESEGLASLSERLSALIAVARFLPEHTLEDHGRFTNAPGPLPSVSTPGALTGGYNPDLIAADEQFVRAAKHKRGRAPRGPMASGEGAR